MYASRSDAVGPTNRSTKTGLNTLVELFPHGQTSGGIGVDVVRAFRGMSEEGGEGDSAHLEVKGFYSLQAVIPRSPLAVEVRVKMQNGSLSRHFLL